MTDMPFFNKLPQTWQFAIDAEITNFDGDLNPKRAMAFRELEAEYLDGLVLPVKPNKKWRDEFSASYCDFSCGWDAAKKSASIDN